MSDHHPQKSHWIKVIGFVPVAYLVGIAVGTLFVLSTVFHLNVPLTGSDTIFVLGAVSVVLIFLSTVSLPYALHRDIALLNTRETDADWAPDRSKYVRRALYGLTIPGLSLLVSSYYLYRIRSTGLRT